MKKFFIFIAVFLIFSAVASAQRVDAEVDSLGYKVIMLKAKVLKYSADTSNNMLDFYYEPSEQAVYVSMHGNSHGRLYLQKGEYTKETVAQCINRLIEENEHLFHGLPVRKVYLMACYEESRHRDNPKNLYIGHSDFFNVDIYEISRFCGQSRSTHYIKNGMIYSIEYDWLNANPFDNKKIYKLAKKAAESAGADWAVEMLKRNKKF